jgi:hypothetical protein
MKYIGIIGSRRRNTKEDFELVLKTFMDIYKIGDQIVSGGCKKGADNFAQIISRTANIPITEHLPDESKLDRTLPIRIAYAQINYARNGLISNDSDVIIACVAPDRKGGTEDTIQKFCRKNKKSEKLLILERKLVLV